MKASPFVMADAGSDILGHGLPQAASRRISGGQLFLLLLAEDLLWARSKGLLNWRGPAKPKLTVYSV